jgi:hypothetical protein
MLHQASLMLSDVDTDVSGTVTGIELDRHCGGGWVWHLGESLVRRLVGQWGGG